MNLCTSTGRRENKQNKVEPYLWDTLYYQLICKCVLTNLMTFLNLSMFRDVVPASSLSSARSGGMLYMENNCVHGEK